MGGWGAGLRGVVASIVVSVNSKKNYLKLIYH
uniref:Uncharacterized protein n=1 Tax=Anguilla anguilla TaxID=7936 RepID=A0A0E9RRG3_ANGAN